MTEQTKNTEYIVEEFKLEEEHYPHIVQITNDAFSGHHLTLNLLKNLNS